MQKQIMWFLKVGGRKKKIKEEEGKKKKKAWHKQKHLAGFLASPSNTGLYFHYILERIKHSLLNLGGYALILMLEAVI